MPIRGTMKDEPIGVKKALDYRLDHLALASCISKHLGSLLAALIPSISVSCIYRIGAKA